MNHRAYLAHQNAETIPEENAVPKIVREVHSRLKSYPIPEYVDRKVMAQLLPGRIAFEPDPVRLLQRFANEARLDEILFREAWFNAAGELRVDGLLGTEVKEAHMAQGNSWPAQRSSKRMHVPTERRRWSPRM